MNRENRKKRRITRWLVLLFVISANLNFLATQDMTEDENSFKPIQRDTTIFLESLEGVDNIDTLRSIQSAKFDSVIVRDSLKTSFIERLGSITDDSDSLFSQRDILWTDAKTINQVLWKYPTIFVRNLGETDSPLQIWCAGVYDSRITVYLDGRPFNNPITEVGLLRSFPLEYVEFAEISIGRYAVAPSDVTINIVSRSFANIRPKTKIRYVQEPNETLHTDAFFAQNILRGLNLSFGLHRRTSDGNYGNSSVDVWNGRSKLRYNLSQYLNVSLSWMYNQRSGGVNYGIQYPQRVSIFNPVQAEVNDENAFEKEHWHDIAFHTLSQWFADSSVRTSVTVYTTTLEHEFRNPPSEWNNPNERILLNGRRRGMIVQQSARVMNMEGVLRYEFRKLSVDSTSVLPQLHEYSRAVSIDVNTSIFPLIKPFVSYRSEWRRGRQLVQVLGGVDVSVMNSLSFGIRKMWNDRLPTIQEMFWTDSSLIRESSLPVEHHATTIADGTIHFDDIVKISFIAYDRTVRQALWYTLNSHSNVFSTISLSSVPLLKIRGVGGNVQFQLFGFHLETAVNFLDIKISDTTKKIVPQLTSTVEASYRKSFFNDALDAKAGVRLSYYDRGYGMVYQPETGLFAVKENLILGRATVVDFFGIFHIGDAHVSLTWVNAFNVQYILTPVYPMSGSMVKLGVHWDFFD